MATKTYNADGGSDFWNSAGNWSPSGVPVNGDDIVHSHSAQSLDQYFSNFPSTTAGSSFTSGSNVTAENPNSTSSAKRVFVITNDTTPPYAPFSNYWIVPSTFNFTINYPNSPREGATNAAKSATAGSSWYCLVSGSGTINKSGNGYWHLANDNTTLRSNINVLNGGLVAGYERSFGSGYIYMGGDNTFFSTEANNINYNIWNSPLYLVGTGLRLGSYLTDTSGFTGTMTITNVVLRRGVGPEQKTITVAGKNVTATYLYHDNQESNCGFIKYGAATLTINNNPPAGGTYIAGPVQVAEGQVVVNADSVFRGATVYGSTNIVFNPATNYLGNIASGNGFDVGSKTFYVGYANADASYSGTLTGSGIVAKFGTGTWSLLGGSTLSGIFSVNEGTVVAYAGNSLTAPNATHQVTGSGRLQIANGVTVNNGAGTSYLRRTDTSNGALYAAPSTTAGYTTGTILVQGNTVPLEAGAGATLNITATTIQNETGYVGGIYKLGAGTVVINAATYAYTGPTYVAAGTLSATGGALTNTAITVADGAKLLNTKLGSGASLVAAPFSTQLTFESSSKSTDYSTPTTVAGSNALTLVTETLESGDKPIPLLGTAPLTVNGTLVLGAGANQKGRMRHTGNVTFGAGSVIRYSAVPAASTVGTQTVIGDIELNAVTPITLDAPVYSSGGTYTLLRWTGNFSASGYTTAQAQTAVNDRLSVYCASPDVYLAGVNYVYGLNRIDVTLGAYLTDGKQTITGDLQLDAPTPVVLDTSVYTSAGTYVLFAWTGNLTASGYSDMQAAVNDRLNVVPPVDFKLVDKIYDGEHKSIRVVLEAYLTAGKQSIVGDLELTAATPVVLDSSVYTTAGTYVLFAWTDNLVYDTGAYANPQAAVDALVNITPPAGLAVTAKTYDSVARSIRITLA